MGLKDLSYSLVVIVYVCSPLRNEVDGVALEIICTISNFVNPM